MPPISLRDSMRAPALWLALAGLLLATLGYGQDGHLVTALLPLVAILAGSLDAAAVLAALYANALAAKVLGAPVPPAVLAAVHVLIVLALAWRGSLLGPRDPQREAWRWPAVVLAALVAIVLVVLRGPPLWPAASWGFHLMVLAVLARPAWWRTAFRWGGAHALALIAAPLLGVLAYEVGSRALWRESPQPLALRAPEPDLLWEQAAHARHAFEAPALTAREADPQPRLQHIVTNAQGLRGPEVAPKEPDEYRILIVGGRHTLAPELPAEEAAPAQLEIYLADALPARRVRVINAGQIEAAPWQLRERLYESWYALEPDLVLLQLYLPTDLPITLRHNPEPPRRLRVFDPHTVMRWRRLEQAQVLPVRLDNALLRHSNAYVGAAGEDLERLHAVTLWNALRAAPPQEMAPLPRPDFLHLLHHPDRARVALPMLMAWRLYERDIRGIQQECASRNIDFACYVLPYPFDFERAYRDLAPFAGAGYRIDFGVQRLHLAFMDAGIPFASMLNVFRAHPRPADLVYWPDEVLTRAGHALVAQRLAVFVQDLLWPALGVVPPLRKEAPAIAPVATEADA